MKIVLFCFMYVSLRRLLSEIAVVLVHMVKK